VREKDAEHQQKTVLRHLSSAEALVSTPRATVHACTKERTATYGKAARSEARVLVRVRNCDTPVLQLLAEDQKDREMLLPTDLALLDREPNDPRPLSICVWNPVL
jgi:hypothetical protein